MTETELVEDILALAGIPAPTFSEESRVAWLERRLAGAPGRTYRDAVGNLVWKWGEVPLRLLVLAHLDTVFPAEVPLVFRHQGERLVGPGIGDNAAAVVVVMHAVSRLLERQGPRRGAVAFTVGEEGLGDLRGAREACRDLQPELALAVEGHGLESVIVDAVGSRRARIRVEGPGGHSWVDRATPSAVHALLAFGEELTARAASDEPVNVGIVRGGQSVNTIAAEAEMLVEMRALDEQPLDAFEQALRAATVEPPLTVSVEFVGRRPSGRLDRESTLLAAVRSVRARLGLTDILTEGSTDANAAISRGIPALALGVARGGAMHSQSEWIDAASLALGLRQVEEVIDALTSVLTRGECQG